VVKVEVAASELKNSKIEKLSLVTNGAIRQGFKILKTDEIPEDSSIREKIGKFFSNDDDSAAKVAALFVRKDAIAKWMPAIKSNGFRAEKEHAELDGDVLILKQESYNPEAEGSLIALTPDVAIQLDRVVKSFDAYPNSSSFEDNVKSAAFFPGLHNALSSLADTVWNVLNETDSPEDAATEVAKQVKAFGAHVNNLVGELPTAVFKMEQETLTEEFEGSNVSLTQPENTVTKDEEPDMTSIQKEAAAGDLDGLLDDAPAADAALAKAEATASVTEIDDSTDDSVTKGDEGAPKSGGSPGNPVVESTSDTGAVSLDEGGVPAGFRKEERVTKQLEGGQFVEKTAIWFINEESNEEIFGGFKKEEEPAATVEATNEADGVEHSPADLKMFEAMGVLAKSMTELKAMVEKQDSKIEAISKTADEAKETADETVVMSVAGDLDESLASLAGSARVRKTDVEKRDDPFVGLLPLIEGIAG
jgi:hypothetical protein